jgi:hypothetical protein
MSFQNREEPVYCLISGWALVPLEPRSMVLENIDEDGRLPSIASTIQVFDDIVQIKLSAMKSWHGKSACSSPNEGLASKLTTELRVYCWCNASLFGYCIGCIEYIQTTGATCIRFQLENIFRDRESPWFAMAVSCVMFSKGKFTYLDHLSCCIPSHHRISRPT